MSAKRKILSGHLLSWQDSRSGSPLPQHRDGEKEGCQPEAVDAQAVSEHLWGSVCSNPSQPQTARKTDVLAHCLYQRSREQVRDQLASRQPVFKPEFSPTFKLFSPCLSFLVYGKRYMLTSTYFMGSF